MRPETTGLELLAAIEQTLARDVAPTLAGEARFKTLMAASALRMVMRELADAEALAAASSRLDAFGARAGLVEAVRAGRHDADAALHAALLEDARARTLISNPARAASKTGIDRS
jgi:hypothetical protein